MSYGHGRTGGLCGPSHSLLDLCCTTHRTTQLPSPLARPPPLPFRAPLPPVSPPRCAPWFYPVVGGCVARQGWGGGGPDAGSGPSLREFPHGGADACTPRQGVTLLYGPSICTRSVQMDLRRNQVRRPFPTPGSGTLWVSGESLRDRRVSCLPRWTVCPTRSPSQDTNRSTCRGECSWSGPLATPPGRCHLGPLANGPGRNPPYCLRSGGADTDTGGGPKPLRSGYLTSVSCGLLSPRPPPVRSGPCLPAFFPIRVGLLCFFFAAWRLHHSPPVSPPGVSVCPLPPPPMSPRRLLADLAPFLDGWGRRGWGGASPLPVLWRKHVASTAQARGAAPVPLQGGGGGLPCGSRRRPSYPAFAPPVPPPLGLARRVLPTGTVVWSGPHPLPAASPPCRFVLGGGGGGRFPPPLPSSPTLGGAEVCGGGPLPSSLRSTHVAGTTQARRRHEARHLSPCRGGGGLAVWLPSSPFLPCVRTPGGPPVGACTARAPYGHGRVVRPAPSRRCLPTLPLCPRGGGGGLSAPPPYLHPPPLGGRRCVGGGGAFLSSSLRSTHVAGMTQARRRHEARHLSLCRGGGGACRVAPVVALPTLRSHPRCSPCGGLHGACSLRARSCGPSRTLSPLPPHPAAVSSGGGGALSAPPFLHPPPLGGRRCVGGGAPLSSSLRSTHVAGTTRARRKHEVRHLAAAGGGGGFSFGPSRPSPWYRLRTPGSPAAVAPWR